MDAVVLSRWQDSEAQMTLQSESEATDTRKSYISSQHKPTWCPGCGDFGVLTALDRALVRLNRPEHDIAIVAGIGCSSRFPFFMNTYGFHSAHGRALSVATGLKTARPDLTVVATGGDGMLLQLAAITSCTPCGATSTLRTSRWTIRSTG